MRRIICRFENESGLNRLIEKNKNLSIHVDEFNLDANKKIRRNKSTKDYLPNDKYECETHYVNMPEYQSKHVEAYHTITFYTEKSSEELTEFFDQNMTDKTKSIYFPKKEEYHISSKYRVLGGTAMNKYPIYVVSKNRSTVCSTSIYLSLMGINHFVTVEPDEVEVYKENLDPNHATVLELDMKYKEDYDTFSDLGNTNSTGPGAARNFCWDHSISNGHKWHWVFDDNTTEGFFWFYQNSRVKLRSPAFFRAVEDFIDRYDNIAIAGLNYKFFCVATQKYPPYVLNTRIYSYLLIRNDIPYRWRGRYNEDTDLSLRVLNDGWCTIQFNSMLAGKAATQTVKGGNTEEFYENEGTYNKSKMLYDMFPRLVDVVWKFGRWHHYVNYSIFKQKLKLKDGVDLSQYPKINNYGMKIIKVDEDHTKNSKLFLEEKYSDELSNYTKPEFNDYSEKVIDDPFEDFYI